MVLLVPGIINPAALSYGPLLHELDGRARLVVKELEVYAGEEVPPPGYSVRTEAEGIARAADRAGLERFHLVGYSAGGIAALAFAEMCPHRPLSLTLIEPFMLGTEERSQEEEAFMAEAARIARLPDHELLPQFLRLNLRRNVEPPTPAPDPPPDWMALRPRGIRALIRSAQEASFDWERLRGYNGPVLMVHGSLSHPAWELMGERLAHLFPNIEVEVYEGLHHLTPPQRAEPERFARKLLETWEAAGK